MPKQVKAGLIPYFYDVECEEFRFLFQVSSDPKFGGADPMISKGCCDVIAGFQELPAQTAIREAQEELGITVDNLGPMFEVGSKEYQSYTLHIFAAEAFDPTDLKPVGFETAQVIWMTKDEFEQLGRNDHRSLVRQAESILMSIKKPVKN
jgi:8-oxo-dGTP pyrophosphatase MutT (NUDIX family)